MLFVPGKKTNMTNRRKIRLYWEQQNHKHESKRILKGEVINILLLGRPVESLHNLGENEKSKKPLYLQEKMSEAAVFTLKPGGGSRESGERSSQGVREHHCSPQHHSPGLRRHIYLDSMIHVSSFQFAIFYDYLILC